MTYKSILSKFMLPTEIKALIIDQLTSRRDIVAVMQANSTLRALAEPLLYRSIFLSEKCLKRSIRCCGTIISRPTAAKAVKEIDIWTNFEIGLPLAGPFFRLVVRVLRVTTNLVSLRNRFYTYNLPVLSIYPFLPTYPHLRSLVSVGFRGTFEFVARHAQTLECFLGEFDGGLQEGYRQIPALPRLRSYAGPSPNDCVRKLVGPGLVYFAPNRETVPHIQRTLSLCGDTLKVLMCHVEDWDSSAFSILADNVPLLEALVIQNDVFGDVAKQEFIDSILAALPRFKRLKRLMTVCYRDHDPVRDLQLVSACQKAAPSLCEVAFNGRFKWQLKGPGQTWRVVRICNSIDFLGEAYRYAGWPKFANLYSRTQCCI
ncbi:hypothetical protein FRC02_011435 [Tulasnella sp. 418]|nr:hypothetical protein FRC02_011435 [Tulasnella sp. 418]